MNRRFNYTTVDTIFAKFNRDMKDHNISEGDILEWTGEVLGVMKIAEIQEESLAFMEVTDYSAPIPEGFQKVIQLARNNNWNYGQKLAFKRE